MTNNLFIKTVVISVAGHMSLFTFFSFSFGGRIPPADFSSVSFWGGLLSGSETSRPLEPSSSVKQAQVLSSKLQPGNGRAGAVLRQEVLGGVKPQQPLSLCDHKAEPVQKTYSDFLPERKKEQVLIFHPLLPHNFFLYFADRQVAHVELMFKAPSPASGRPIMIKRKISSGNLEADLLTMRYMSHYFFIRRENFNPDSWQTIKIDLSAKE